MELSAHSAILCSMAFHTTFVTYGFFVIKRGFERSFWFGSKLFLFRETRFLIRPRRFLIMKFSKVLKGFSTEFRFVMFLVRFCRTLTITIFGSRSLKGVIIELFTETA